MNHAPLIKVKRLPALYAAVGLMALTGATTARAAEFALAVSPPRVELQIKAGERIRQVIEITNAAQEATTLSIQTADWSLSKDNSVTFYDDLQPGSCRPWIALERRELTVAGGKPYRFRFEVNAPADAKPEECRLAIMLEGKEQLTQSQGGVSIPFSARLGVIVYLEVGGALPNLQVVGYSVKTINGLQTPTLDVQNTGTAHGRMGGFLAGTDASKTALEFTPSNSPVLPGETRSIALSATRPGDTETLVQPKFPVTISGKLEWGKGQTKTIEQRFAP